MCLGGYIHVSAGAHRGQQYQILLELKFQEVVNYPDVGTWN